MRKELGFTTACERQNNKIEKLLTISIAILKILNVKEIKNLEKNLAGIDID